MSETVTITGLAELNKRLRELPAKLQKTIMRRALGAGGAAGVIKKAAIARAPIASMPVHRGGGNVTQPGVLKAAAIVKFLRSESNDTQSVYIVTFRRGKRAQRIGKRARNLDAFYASWVEFGHKIVPRVRRTGRDRRGRFINSRTIRARRASSGGQVAGRRFLTRAFNEAGQQALSVFETKLRSGFDAAVR